MRRQEQAMKIWLMAMVIATEFVGPLMPEWQPENPFVCMPPPRFQSDSPVNHFSFTLRQWDDVAPHERWTNRQARIFHKTIREKGGIGASCNKASSTTLVIFCAFGCWCWPVGPLSREVISIQMGRGVSRIVEDCFDHLYLTVSGLPIPSSANKLKKETSAREATTQEHAFHPKHLIEFPHTLFFESP